MDYIKVTDATVLANITIQFKNNELQYVTKDGLAKATVNLYGRITSISRRPVNWFEDTVQVQVPSEMLQQGHDRGAGLFQVDSAAPRDLPLEHRRQRRDWRNREQLRDMR